MGSNVLFTATASGPVLSYQWVFNETNLLVGATNNTLVLNNLSVGQSGRYSVLVSNFAGAVLSQPAVLEVNPVQGVVMPVKLTGAVGSTWQIEYVNELGAASNWPVLATVTLTNSPQIYYDTSARGHPHRFYRLVPLP